MTSATEEMVAAEVEREDRPTVPVDRIDPSPKNRRLADDDPALMEFADNLRAARLINPITVRPMDDGRYEIVSGERRWRAYRLLGRAAIPAFVKAMDERQAQVERVIENLCRQGLTPIEEGEGVAVLLEECGGNVAEVAARLGCHESWVRRRARLPKLTAAWRAELAREDTLYPHIRDCIERLEEVAILPPETQDAVLEDGLLVHTRKTRDLRAALATFLMNLDHKPWSRKWEKESISGRKRCDACLKRSDKEKTLFGPLNAAAGDGAARLCLDPDCWHRRIMAWCRHLHDEHPGATLLWDGYINARGVELSREYFGCSPASVTDWRERVDETPPHALYTEPGVGIFLGGARAGQVIDIWLRVAAVASKHVAVPAESHQPAAVPAESRQSAEDRAAVLRMKVADMVPEDVGLFAQAARLGDLDLAVCLLNWGGWFGIGERRYSESAFDVLNTKYGEYPGRQHAWSQIRYELIIMLCDMAQGDDEDLTENDRAIAAFVVEELKLDMDALSAGFAAGAEA